MHENDRTVINTSTVANGNEIEGSEGSALLPAAPYRLNSGGDPSDSNTNETVFDSYAEYMIFAPSTDLALFKAALFANMYEGRLEAMPTIKGLVTTSCLQEIYNGFKLMAGATSQNTTQSLVQPPLSEVHQMLRSEEADQARLGFITANQAGINLRIENALKGLPVNEAAIDELQVFISFRNPSFNAYDKVAVLYTAMFGGFWPGTDEEKIFSTLEGLNPLEVIALEKTYTFYCATVKGDGRRDLRADLDSEMDGLDQERYESLLNGNENAYIASSLREAVDNSFLGVDFGTDEDAIMSILRNKTPEQIAAISAEYKKLYGEDLKTRLTSELDEDSHDLARMNALMQSNTNEADAHALDQAMHGTFLGIDFGTNEDQIEAVYSDIRTDVESAPGASALSYDELNQKIRDRNSAVETEYNSNYSVEGDNASSLRNAFDNETELLEERGEGELFNALADNDLDAIDASRMVMEFADFVTSDEAVNDILENQNIRAREEVTRNHQGELTKALEGVTDRFERERIEREFNNRMAVLAEEVTRINMQNFQNEYDEIPNLGITLEHGIDIYMVGAAEDNAHDLLENQGVLSPAQTITHAINGVGTDLDDIRGALEGRTVAEIAAIDIEFTKLNGMSLREALFNDHIMGITELSGRDARDIRLMLDHGVATNREEELEIAQARYQNELEMAGENGVSMDEMSFHLERMQRFNSNLDEAENGGDQDILFNESLLGIESETFDNSVARYRAEVDAITSAITTIASVVIGVVIAIATAGAGSGLSVAIISSAVGSAANIGLRRVMQGGAYGNEAIATDIALGVLDAATAGLTRNMGDELIEGSAYLTRLTNDPAFRSRLLAKTIAEAYASVPGNFSQTIAGEVLNESNWVAANGTDDLSLRMLETLTVNGAMGIAQSLVTNVALEGLGTAKGTDTNEENLVEGNEGTVDRGIGDDTNDVNHLIDGGSSHENTSETTTAVKDWNDSSMTVSEFLVTTKLDNPKTSLSTDELINKYNQGLRFNPETRRWNRVTTTNQLKEMFMGNLAVKKGVTLTTEQKNVMWKMYIDQDFTSLYDYSKHLLKWPPANGGTGHEFNKPILAGEIFDRYGSVMDVEGEDVLTGSFFSTMEAGDGQSFESRALNLDIGKYDVYYKVEILKDLDFTATQATAIPWYGLDGMGIQSEWSIPKAPGSPYSITLTQLEKDGFIKITILDSPNSKYDHLIDK